MGQRERRHGLGAMVKDRAIGMVFKIQGRDSVDGSVGGGKSNWKFNRTRMRNEELEIREGIHQRWTGRWAMGVGHVARPLES